MLSYIYVQAQSPYNHSYFYLYKYMYIVAYSHTAIANREQARHRLRSGCVGLDRNATDETSLLLSARIGGSVVVVVVVVIVGAYIRFVSVWFTHVCVKLPQLGLYTVGYSYIIPTVV